MLGGYKANIRQPPKRGQPLKRGQRPQSQSVLCSEVLLYNYNQGYGRLPGPYPSAKHHTIKFLVYSVYSVWLRSAVQTSRVGLVKLRGGLKMGQEYSTPGSQTAFLYEFQSMRIHTRSTFVFDTTHGATFSNTPFGESRSRRAYKGTYTGFVGARKEIPVL